MSVPPSSMGAQISGPNHSMSQNNMGFPPSSMGLSSGASINPSQNAGINSTSGNFNNQMQGQGFPPNSGQRPAPAAPRRLDPDQMPSPVQVILDDKVNNSG